MRRDGIRQEATARNVAEMAAQIAELGSMTAGELRDRFHEVYGEPTRSRNKVYMRKKIAWQIQALAEGGLSQRALDRIEELAPLAPVRWRPNLKDIHVPAVEPAGQRRGRDPRLPPAGTHITREHKGKVFKVHVLERGFVYEGQQYASLSKVARAITSTHWNGFLFFGLTEKKSRGEAAL